MVYPGGRAWLSTTRLHCRFGDEQSNDALGTKNTWQAGAAGVVVKALGGGSVMGALLTWQTDFAGGDDRVDTNLMTSQVFLTLMVDQGWYLRSVPLWLFNFQNEI